MAGEKIGQIWHKKFEMYYRNKSVKNVQLCLDGSPNPKRIPSPQIVRENCAVIYEHYISKVLPYQFNLMEVGAFPFFYAPFIFLGYSEC